jgi:hypothetical protein
MIPLILTIVLSKSAVATPRRLLVDLEFKNTSKSSIHLLKYFKDETNLSIWFQLHMTLLDGTPVPGIRGGGKIGLQEPLEYVMVPPGKTFSLQIDFAKFVTDLQPGTYEMSITYRNQYGNDCFKGELTSNTVVVQVLPNPD